ncbi:MAG: SDR family oxidoreductase [Chromatiales bacterium]|jgi:3-oxoacyl-[acyl-carrier protein] reductase|nr:SDR family oxidoreductase [Chromatiales bacterium]
MDSTKAGVLEGKIALVTGGNTGIGEGVCRAFGAAGADVAVAWFQDRDAADALVNLIEKMGRRAFAVRIDVTEEASVEDGFDAVAAQLGNPQILVNNAGIQQRQGIMDLSVADFDRMLAVHLRGGFLCARAFARRRISAGGGGRIINLCSQLGYIGRSEYTAYSAAKGGVIAFTRALARELAPHGILVNGVAPGLVDTGFDPLPEDAKLDHAQSLPLGRLGTVEDMTSAFVFLASDAGRYYCGQLLHPNGGEIMP